MCMYVCVIYVLMFLPLIDCSFSHSEIGMSGEVLKIRNISRYCDDIYECVAFNGVPPSVSRQIKVSVQCKFVFVLFLCVFFSLPFIPLFGGFFFSYWLWLISRNFLLKDNFRILFSDHFFSLCTLLIVLGIIFILIIPRGFAFFFSTSQRSCRKEETGSGNDKKIKHLTKPKLILILRKDGNPIGRQNFWIWFYTKTWGYKTEMYIHLILVLTSVPK